MSCDDSKGRLTILIYAALSAQPDAEGGGEKRRFVFDSLSDGYCPQCLLHGESIFMKPNMVEFWECPKCRLQAHTSVPLVLAIVRERGHGHLRRMECGMRINSYLLTRAGTMDEARAGEVFPAVGPAGFQSEEELRTFLLEKCGMGTDERKGRV